MKDKCWFPLLGGTRLGNIGETPPSFSTASIRSKLGVGRDVAVEQLGGRGAVQLVLVAPPVQPEHAPAGPRASLDKFLELLY